MIVKRKLGYYVLSKKTRRNLEPGESVHHIDGNKSNISLENLYLCDHSLHRKTDLSAQYLVYELYNKGIVGFDKEKGIYYLKEFFKHRKS